jgi:hypothetical protein
MIPDDKLRLKELEIILHAVEKQLNRCHMLLFYEYDEIVEDTHNQIFPPSETKKIR